MTTATVNWTEQILDVADTKLELLKGGTGDPLLILHGEMGHPGRLRYHEALAQRRTLYMPSHPGFGRSQRLDWIMTMRDLAGWYLRALDELALDRVDVVGFSLGGWLAAEMAAMSPRHFKKMVLVSPQGIRPPRGEIFDMFLVVAREYLEEGFHDPEAVDEFKTVLPDEPSKEQAEAWEVAREEACRLTWRPYMHDPALPHLLRRLKNLPTLLLWGKEDTVVPPSAGEVYRDSIHGANLVLLDDCGHHPEIERTDEFLKLTETFLRDA